MCDHMHRLRSNKYECCRLETIRLHRFYGLVCSCSGRSATSNGVSFEVLRPSSAPRPENALSTLPIPEERQRICLSLSLGRGTYCTVQGKYRGYLKTSEYFHGTERFGNTKSGEYYLPGHRYWPVTGLLLASICGYLFPIQTCCLVSEDL